MILWAAAWAGDPPAEEEGGAVELVVPLAARVPEGEARLTWAGPRAFAVEHTLPRLVFDVPELGDDPLFFRMTLGQTQGVPFFAALGRSEDTGEYDRLWIDLDRDLDLTDDGGPAKGHVRLVGIARTHMVEFVDLQLSLPYTVEGESFTELYPIVVYHVPREDKGPAQVLVERDGWREGSVTVDGQAYALVLVDDDTDGLFSIGDSWMLRPADERAGPVSRDAVRSMRFRTWTRDQKHTLEVTTLDVAGRRATLRVEPARETEHEYFARVARESQSPEERQLGLDPLRPKAEPGREIDWLVGKEAAYALEVAASPQVNKRVLLDFTAPDCEWCARMERYTWRDREVVQLAEQFVCARIAFTAGAGDAKKYRVEGTPTLIVLDTNGTEIARQVGFARPEAFAAWLRSALR